ncbi:hypothetical protein PHLCEN_2v3600 [Hermanssonia centrifuga]|uniref:Uncharacterized protein n=1 Tax=Hermanssonia centrifuga TaxID=98765 RepID=A0A2R6QER3_9APHY|nr:hypothetical protein PHLCEN_2v3600 [Hermanssonia centrifuga]
MPSIKETKAPSSGIPSTPNDLVAHLEGTSTDAASCRHAGHNIGKADVSCYEAVIEGDV